MTAQILDGKAVAKTIRQELAAEVASFKQQTGVTPKLAAVLVGSDPASQVYVRNKQKACAEVGMESQLVHLPQDVSQSQLMELVRELNATASVHGILVQLPLPRGLDATAVLDAVSPDKDVDAFHPVNVGLISQGRPRFLPCTPHGVQQLLHRSQIPVEGQHVVIVGRSDIVGKPLAMMWMQRSSTLGSSAANASVTVCHSRSRNLSDLTRQADILVAAVGQPQLITADMVRPGAVVVDVGINRVGDRLVGDVDFDAVSQVASHITPVPGGVGPLTIAMLLRNTLTAAQA